MFKFWIISAIIYLHWPTYKGPIFRPILVMWPWSFEPTFVPLSQAGPSWILTLIETMVSEETMFEIVNGQQNLSDTEWPWPQAQIFKTLTAIVSEKSTGLLDPGWAKFVFKTVLYSTVLKDQKMKKKVFISLSLNYHRVYTWTYLASSYFL